MPLFYVLHSTLSLSLLLCRRYLLQTNYDHWVDPPIFDDRRNYGLRYVNAIGEQKASLSAINDVLSMWPVRNDDTSQTILMDPLNSKWTFYIDNFVGNK